MKTQFISKVLLIVFVLSCCWTSFVLSQPVRNIVVQPALKLEGLKIRNARELIRDADFLKVAKKNFTLEGYFVSDPIPMLVTDMKWYLANTMMPDSVFVLLEGDVAKTLMDNKSRYFGTYIRIEGNLRLDKRQSVKGETREIRVIGTKLTSVLKERAAQIVVPEVYNICKKYPKICEISSLLTKNYALLYSGGINPTYAYSRYWNDLKFMYKTLKSKFGYTDEQIVVVFKDGVALDAEMTVDYAASKTGFANAISYLQSHLKNNSDLFFFITNHGGGYNTSDGLNYSGIVDAAPTDEIDAHHYDETVFYYNEADNKISDDTLAVYLNKIVGTSGNRKLVAVLEPCFSGGLLRDLRGTNRALASAANEFEFSWAGAPGNHDMFSYYFTCALNGADHLGTAVNADTSGDGKVSFYEAYIYARDHDSTSEEPLLEDNGDGVGTHNPSGAGAADGVFSKTVFLQ